MSETTGLVPPPEHEHLTYHWLKVTDCTVPHVATWHRMGWWEILGRKAESPDYMHSYGWRYIAPCVPPEAPHA